MGRKFLTDIEFPDLVVSNKGSKIVTQPSSDHSWTGNTTMLTAGTGLVFGDICYQGSDGKMEKTDADAVATAFCWAIALGTINEDSAGEFALPGSFIKDNSWSFSSVGQPVFLSTNTGALTQTAPTGTDDVIQIVGIAYAATILYFFPSLSQVEHI